MDIGVTMVHLNARDKRDGMPTHEAEEYKKIIAGIREFASDLVVCVSLSGRMVNEFEKRAACLGLEGDTKQDMGSLTLSSVNFNHQTSVNSPIMLIRGKKAHAEVKQKRLIKML